MKNGKKKNRKRKDFKITGCMEKKKGREQKGRRLSLWKKQTGENLRTSVAEEKPEGMYFLGEWKM